MDFVVVLVRHHRVSAAVESVPQLVAVNISMRKERITDLCSSAALLTASCVQVAR